MRTFFVLVLLSICTFTRAQDVSLQGDTGSREHIPYFIMLGDPQIDNPPRRDVEDNYNAVRDIFKQIEKENPAFLFLLGDLVFSGEVEMYWKKFDHLITPVREKQIPTYSIFGNHEYFAFPQNLYRHFFARFPHLEYNTYYELGFKNVRILALNSNFDFLSKEEKQEQVLWYRDRLRLIDEDSSISSIIVTCHHPPYSNSEAIEDDGTVQMEFVQPYLLSKKAKLFVCGHSHSYEHFLIEGKHFINSGGAGPHQTIRASLPTKQDLYSKEKGERPHNYLKITPENEGLFIEMMKLTGSVFSVGDTVSVK
jgi:3',5'-cyclic AMP phosphodiesterase CpdA